MTYHRPNQLKLNLLSHKVGLGCLRRFQEFCKQTNRLLGCNLQAKQMFRNKEREREGSVRACLCDFDDAHNYKCLAHLVSSLFMVNVSALVRCCIPDGWIQGPR